MKTFIITTLYCLVALVGFSVLAGIGNLARAQSPPPPAPDSVWVNTPVPFNAATVKWNAVTGALGYEISRRFNAYDQETWRWQLPNYTSDTSFTLTGLYENEKYQVRVRALHEDSTWSNYTLLTNFKTGADTNYAHLDRFAANVQITNVTAHSFEIDWDTLANDTAGYLVYFNQQYKDEFTPIYTDTNYLNVNAGLFPGTEYRIIVVGCV